MTVYTRTLIHCKVGNWSSRYTVECLAPVVEATQAAKSPSYQTILDLDRKIREFTVPVSTDATDADGVPTGMRYFAQSYYRELSACRSNFKFP